MALQQPTNGFTIVELLIVIVVIAILAAITIVAYNGIQNSAYDSTVQSDIGNAAKKIELYRISNGSDLYTSNGNTQLEPIGMQATLSAYAVEPQITRNFVYCANSGRTDFAIAGISKSGNAYYATGNNLTVRPYTGTWSSGTAAATICIDIMSDNNALFTAGYYNASGYTGGWAPWTGA